jgi:predicted transcriptional regulator
VRDKLSLDDYIVLFYIYKRSLNGESELTQPMEIATCLNIKRNRIYLILDKLCKMGYIERLMKSRRGSGGYYTIWSCTSNGATFIKSFNHMLKIEV